MILYEDSYRNMSIAISNGNAAAMLHAVIGQAAQHPARLTLEPQLGAKFDVPACARVGRTERRRRSGSPSPTSLTFGGCAENHAAKRGFLPARRAVPGIG